MKNTRTPRRSGWLFPLVYGVLIAFFSFLWIRSYWRADVLLICTRDGSAQGIESHQGKLVLAMSNLSLGPERSLTAEWIPMPSDDGVRLYETAFEAFKKRERFGFGYAVSDKGELAVPEASHVAGMIPHWALVALLAGPFVVRTRRAWLRSRRQRQGRCLFCGYDLRGSAGRCPECGTETDVRQERQMTISSQACESPA